MPPPATAHNAMTTTLAPITCTSTITATTTAPKTVAPTKTGYQEGPLPVPDHVNSEQVDTTRE